MHLEREKREKSTLLATEKAFSPGLPYIRGQVPGMDDGTEERQAVHRELKLTGAVQTTPFPDARPHRFDLQPT